MRVQEVARASFDSAMEKQIEFELTSKDMIALELVLIHTHQIMEKYLQKGFLVLEDQIQQVVELETAVQKVIAKNTSARELFERIRAKYVRVRVPSQNYIEALEDPDDISTMLRNLELVVEVGNNSAHYEEALPGISNAIDLLKKQLELYPVPVAGSPETGGDNHPRHLKIKRLPKPGHLPDKHQK